MSKIKFAPGLSFPIDAVTQTFAFLARRGAGKSYGAGVAAEGMFGAGAQIVVLDPVGTWYGLRLAPNGRSKGLDIPVFGGEHGDIPLEPTGGALVARAVVEHGTSVVLDVSHFRKGQRKQFCTDFAEELFHLKKTHRSPIHLFVEEAQMFVPQKVFHGEERMLGAFEDIVKLGRNYGIGATLISQRPQAVSKDVLNQTECLVVLQTNGAQERAALKLWMQEKDVDVSYLDELPGLQKGEAFVWSPSWLRLTKRVKIGTKTTFDASATPEVGKRAVERKLAPLDLRKLETAMKETVERAKAEDPKALQRRVRELEAQNQKLHEVLDRTDHAASYRQPKEKRVEVSVIDKGDLKRLERAVKQLEKIGTQEAVAVDKLGEIRDRASQAQQTIVSSLDNLTTVMRVEPKLARAPYAHGSAHIGSVRAVKVPTAKPAKQSVVKDLPNGVTKYQQGILDSLAWFRAVGINSPKRAAVAGVAGVHQGGYFGNSLGALRSAGFISYPRGRELALTDAGIPLANAPEVTPSRAGLQATVLNTVSTYQADLLRVIIGNYPNSLSRAELAEKAGKDEGGYFGNSLGALRTMEMIDYPDRGYVVASEILFPPGLA